MPKFGEYFKNLVTMIIGGVPSQNVDVGKALDEIDERLNKTSYSNLFEMLVHTSNQAKIKDGSNSKSPKEVRSLVDLINVNSDYQDQIYDLFIRRKKYQSYRDMTKKISRLGRAVKVLRSNIISSDSIRNRSLMFKPIDSDVDYEKDVTEAKDIFRHLKIDDHRNLRKIIDHSLTYGDFYVEIATKQDVMPNTKTHLMENKSSESDRRKVASYSVSIDIDKDNKKDFEFTFSLESNGFSNSILESTDSDQHKTTLDDLIILYHKPHNVIKLALGDMVYGYVIIPENIIKSRLIFQNINIFDSNEKIHQLAATMGVEHVYSQKALDRSIDITKNIINFLKENINEAAVEDNSALKSVIAKLVLSSIYAVGLNDNVKSLSNSIETIKIANMDFRFVDVSRMQEFAINIDEYDPYGTSILDTVLFDASLLVSDKITSSIERLTKSIERRIINFEVDNRNSVALIQVLKEKFRKKKAMFDGSNTFDTIPGMISPFEDYYIPKKDGTPYVEFSTEQPTSQHQARVDDMKFKRDEIVGDLNIPPAYLGLEENIESKATLFLQSILFAIEIIDFQECYAANYTDLLNKVKTIIGSSNKNVLVSFPSPIILSSASELEHISNVSSSEDFLTKIGLDSASIRERYLPFLNEYFTNKTKTKLTLDKLEHGDESKPEESGGGF